MPENVTTPAADATDDENSNHETTPSNFRFHILSGFLQGVVIVTSDISSLSDLLPLSWTLTLHHGTR